MNLKQVFVLLLLICIGSAHLTLRATGIEFNHGSWSEIVNNASSG